MLLRVSRLEDEEEDVRKGCSQSFDSHCVYDFEE